MKKGQDLNGMKLFFCSPNKDKKGDLLIEPSLPKWIEKWMDN